MDGYTPLAYVVTMLIAVSLIGAPVTMGDWNEAGWYSVEHIEESQIQDTTPIRQYETLSTPAQNDVRHAIESPRGGYVEYGREDWPADFAFTDTSSPGDGLYIIVYEGQYYRLYTGATASLLFFLYILPFVAYGGVLGLVVRDVKEHDRSPRIALLAAIPGIGFHLLGPEFDFPLLAPMEFIGLGVLATVALVVGLVVGHMLEGYRAA